MKNLKGIILTAALATIFTGQMFAQAATPATSGDQNSKQTTVQAQAFGQFVDNNNNGICDNRELRQGNGTRGKNFVDANGDGICDRRTDGNYGKFYNKKCQGRGYGCCNGKGNQYRCGGKNQ